MYLQNINVCGLLIFFYFLLLVYFNQPQLGKTVRNFLHLYKHKLRILNKYLKKNS